MAKLQDILKQVSYTPIHGALSVEVGAPCIDSRQVNEGNLFIAVKGLITDGHQYIADAVKQGAVAVICEKAPDKFLPETTYIKVENSAEACGWIASNYYGLPSSKLKLVGVTGTNGKTTIATLLFKLFRMLGYSCGLLSTVRNKINDQTLASTHTTPDAIHFNKLLSEMVDAGCEYVFAEVSSHAIHQRRIAGLQFDGGVFSNITHDHLDYHKTFDRYLKAKKAFFDDLSKVAFALTNIDDKHGRVMLQNTSARKRSYGLKNMADYKGKILENTLNGLIMKIDHDEVHFRLPGKFNAYNLLAVYGAAVELGEDRHRVLEKLSGITGAEGRFDRILSPKDHIMGIVDYAHTPDALLNILEAINDLRNGKEQLITVVGCGGDRDKTKRPEMAQVTVQNSDKVIFTSDNPRNEDPDLILKDMEEGVSSEEKNKILTITDRKQAIKTACNLAKPGDIVLVAGKGHEKYQKIKEEMRPFDDKIILNEMFKELNK